MSAWTFLTKDVFFSLLHFFLSKEFVKTVFFPNGEHWFRVFLWGRQKFYAFTTLQALSCPLNAIMPHLAVIGGIEILSGSLRTFSSAKHSNRKTTLVHIPKKLATMAIHMYRIWVHTSE
jgi:hypothetical protein